MNNGNLLIYALHLADNSLILGQRNSEWCGHGPVLEQDIAITNISLDLIGQARNFFQYAALLYNSMTEKEKQTIDEYLPLAWKKFNRELNENDLAFLRDEHQYLNLLLTELPKGDWSKTVLRQFFLSAYQYLLYDRLQNSIDPQLSAIAEKSLKEVSYHQRWSAEWVIRLGDGTEESNHRIQESLKDLWPFTGEIFQPVDFEVKAASGGFGVNISLIKEEWMKKIEQVLQEATLSLPDDEEAHAWIQTGGKQGKHTEYFGYILTEMQYMQRSYPNLTW